MSWLSTIFGGGSQKPMNDANQYLNQIPQLGHNTYDSYINQGKESGGNAHSKFEELMNDPQGFMDKLSSGYKPSENYNFQKDQLTKAMSNTAAAGGVAGTPMDQMNQGEGIQKLLSADQQQYFQNALGLFNTGLQGEQGEATRGYDASGKLNDMLGENLNQQGSLAFNNAQQNNKNKTDFFNTLMKALGGAGGVASNPLSVFGHQFWGGSTSGDQ